MLSELLKVLGWQILFELHDIFLGLSDVILITHD